MKKLKVACPDLIRFAIQQEVFRSDESRYLHRLHALLLISSGQSSQQVSELFGEDRRTVQRWVHRFEADGLDGLRDGEHVGRPATLNERQWERLKRDLARSPNSTDDKRRRWNGKLLAEHLQEKYSVTLGVRQCQRILRQSRKWRLGLSRQRPRGSPGGPPMALRRPLPVADK